MPLILSGDTGVPACGMPTGSVIQTVSTTVNNEFSTSSASMQATYTTATITPTSATSKILVTVSSGLFWCNGSGGGAATIYRNGTNIHPSSNYFVRTYPTNSTNIRLQTTGPISYLDSPASTSALTYTVYIASIWGGTMQWGSSGNDCATITLLEIKA